MELAKHWNSKVYNRVYNKVYNINDAIGTKLITRLSLGFRHLREHKFKLNFRDTLNTLCSCCMEVESTSHYFLWCFADYTYEQFKEYWQRPSYTYRRKSYKYLIIHYSYDNKTNQIILMHVIRYIKDSQRFDEPPFNPS